MWDVLPGLYSALGPGGIALMMLLLGLLSKRMHDTTRGEHVYRWFFASSALLWLSTGARAAGALLSLSDMETDLLWVLLYDGLPAAALLMALPAAWHYWSWLLAERA